jgi:hypothetical protein
VTRFPLLVQDLLKELATLSPEVAGDVVLTLPAAMYQAVSSELTNYFGDVASFTFKLPVGSAAPEELRVHGLVIRVAK